MLFCKYFYIKKCFYLNFFILYCYFFNFCGNTWIKQANVILYNIIMCFTEELNNYY